MVILSKALLNKVNKMMGRNINYTKDDLSLAISRATLIISDILNDTFKGKLFKYGNLKLQNNIARFPLPERITCRVMCKGCYASKMLYQNIRVHRLSNLLIILKSLSDIKFREKLLNVMHLELNTHYNTCRKNKEKAIFRWHDSGDIFSHEHYLLLRMIAVQNPNIKFYTYTKNKDIEMLHHSSKLNNFNIVSSIIKNHVNYFDFSKDFNSEYNQFKQCIDYLRNNNEQLYICSYNFNKFKEQYTDNYKMLHKLFIANADVIYYNKKHLECGKCSACCSYRYTAFLKH